MGGSSRSVRDYIGNGRLAAWAASHPSVEIETKVKNGKHPFLHADYVNNTSYHQVSIKNVDSWRDVQSACQMLFDRSGRKITKITTPVLTDTPSIQGSWTPFLNITEPFDINFEEGQE